MRYADDAFNVSLWARGLAEMIAVVGKVCEKFGRTVPEKKTPNYMHGQSFAASVRPDQRIPVP